MALTTFVFGEMFEFYAMEVCVPVGLQIMIYESFQVPGWKRNILRFLLTCVIMGISIALWDAYAYVGAISGEWYLIILTNYPDGVYILTFLTIDQSA